MSSITHDHSRHSGECQNDCVKQADALFSNLATNTLQKQAHDGADIDGSLRF